MKTYNNNMLKEVNTDLHLPSFKNGDGIQKLVLCMNDDQTLAEWELDTFKNMR